MFSHLILVLISFPLLSTCTDELISAPKIMKFFPMVPSVNENCERESNPMTYPLYLYLSGSVFLVSFADPNKQLTNAKSVSISFNHQSSVYQTCVRLIKQCLLNFISGSGSKLIKVGAKLLSDVVIFIVLSSKIPIDFHDKTLDVLVRNLKYFLYEKYIKLFCNVPEEKYLALLRILYPFIKSFVNHFADIASTLLIAHLVHFQQLHDQLYSS